MRERITAHRSPRPRTLAATAVTLALLTTGCTATPSPAAQTPQAPVTQQPAPQASATPTAAPSTSAPASSRAPLPAGSTLQVVGVGDSVMAGTNCACAGPVAEYAERLGARTPGVRVETANRGVDGATTADLRARLDRDAGLRRELADADVVLVIIGANDVLRAADRRRGATPDAAAVPRMLEQLTAGIDETLADVTAAGGPSTRYLVGGYWNMFPAGDDRDLALVSTALTRTGNGLIEDAAARHGMTYVDVESAFADAAPGDVSTLISDDDLHPNARGVEVIADAFAAAS